MGEGSCSPFRDSVFILHRGSSEFIDPNLGLKVYRNDRASDTHGGVLIAAKKNRGHRHQEKQEYRTYIRHNSAAKEQKNGHSSILQVTKYRRTDEAYLTEAYNELLDLK